jgi:hypothetical protein
MTVGIVKWLRLIVMVVLAIGMAVTVSVASAAAAPASAGYAQQGVVGTPVPPFAADQSGILQGPGRGSDAVTQAPAQCTLLSHPTWSNNRVIGLGNTHCNAYVRSIAHVVYLYRWFGDHWGLISLSSGRRTNLSQLTTSTFRFCHNGQHAFYFARTHHQVEFSNGSTGQGWSTSPARVLPCSP